MIMNKSRNLSDGNMQEKILTKVHELGDMLERAGDKVEKKGFEKIGEAISKLGNRIEHLREEKSSSDHSNQDKSSRAM